MAVAAWFESEAYGYRPGPHVVRTPAPIPSNQGSSSIAPSWEKKDCTLVGGFANDVVESSMRQVRHDRYKSSKVFSS